MTSPRLNLIAPTAVAVAVAVACGAGTATAASPRPAVRALSARPATLSLVDTSHGRLLASAAGVVMYVFSQDRHDHDACARVSGCLKDWPPVTVSGPITVGPGLQRRAVGTITVGRVRQLTYDGHPLYRWAFSTGAPGFVKSIGITAFGGVWEALTRSGTTVR